MSGVSVHEKLREGALAKIEAAQKIISAAYSEADNIPRDKHTERFPLRLIAVNQILEGIWYEIRRHEFEEP